MAFPALLACLLQNTWVVDDTPGPGVDFANLPPAVAAAADGDVLLVQPGTYAPFTLTGKGLRILGSGAATTLVSSPNSASPTTISAIPSGSVVVVDRLRFQALSLVAGTTNALLEIQGPTTQVALADVAVQGAPSQTALRVEAATVWAFRSTFAGGYGEFGTTEAGGHALHVDAGSFVHMSNSSFVGGAGGFGYPSGGPGGAGAWVEGGSDVWISRSSLAGGYPGCAFLGCASPGPGLRVDSSTVRVSGDGSPSSTIVGGSLGSAATPCDWGYGILTSGTASVTVHSVTVEAGYSFGACFPAPATSGPGITLNAPPLPLLEVSGALSLAGGFATVSVWNGTPNGLFFVGVTGLPGFVPPGPAFLGAFLVDPTALFPLYGGFLTPAGTRVLLYDVAGFPASFAYFPFYLQAAVFDAGGASWRLSNSTMTTMRP